MDGKPEKEGRKRGNVGDSALTAIGAAVVMASFLLKIKLAVLWIAR